jgi:phosphoribosylanthranilate isomerase
VGLFIKICGITTVDDAETALELGADAIGVNLIAISKRRVGENTLKRIVDRVNGRTPVIAVVADLAVEELQHLLSTTGVERVQLHGDEPPEVVTELGPKAFKAVRVSGAEDVDKARDYPGEPLLLDAKVEGQLGGTGHVFDWSLAAELSRVRSVLLAGGLRPDNVAEAISQVRPWGVDVASGVEVPGDPRRKDASRMRAFIETARKAAER